MVGLVCLVRFGLVLLLWFGLVWFGLVWFGMVWFGLFWFGLVWGGGVGWFFLSIHGYAEIGCLVTFGLV